ncbi:BZ3500_MvSof-1268-A1-R1_Chr12-2g03789 [Microbotryum saponariae]|uniref:BZ3500_MvSof-1268-A1-R1_Chr12-2g03789 protein n=1 Tax=Microbotryum saponariae TaxID=289078 RepID=A0A2X0MQT5_9BASI|nr:BZ3500_MvSof-1268-A1-R1_Chr12-2g03789 [Microbotryum saponariae]
MTKLACNNHSRKRLQEEFKQYYPEFQPAGLHKKALKHNEASAELTYCSINSRLIGVLTNATISRPFHAKEAIRCNIVIILHSF